MVFRSYPHKRKTFSSQTMTALILASQMNSFFSSYLCQACVICVSLCILCVMDLRKAQKQKGLICGSCKAGLMARWCRTPAVCNSENFVLLHVHIIFSEWTQRCETAPALSSSSPNLTAINQVFHSNKTWDDTILPGNFNSFDNSSQASEDQVQQCSWQKCTSALPHWQEGGEVNSVFHVIKKVIFFFRIRMAADVPTKKSST